MSDYEWFGAAGLEDYMMRDEERGFREVGDFDAADLVREVADSSLQYDHLKHRMACERVARCCRECGGGPDEPHFDCS